MARKSTTTKTSKKTAKPAADKFRPKVHVRMYLQGLGDCFLLRFEYEKGKSFDVLIDCGIYKASPNAGEIMNEVVDDIIATTGNRLDVLVSTHEHWDHISGFHQAIEKFKKMKIDHVWQAWTEDPANGRASKLRQKYEETKTRLTRLLAKQKEKLGARAHVLESAYSVMGFFGVSADGSDSKSEYQQIKELMASKKPRYLSPGEVVKIKDADVKVFVLGPPTDELLLRKQNIAKKDAYEKQHLAMFDNVNAMLSAISASTSEDPEEDLDRPFNRSVGIAKELAVDSEYYQSVYAFDSSENEYWRTIDDIAVAAFETLALRMDNYTNNTSLVLAFQLPSGKVLLFPGDAQGGNWKSWANPEAPLMFDEPKTDALKLLENTILYKVGHHGSHNATPRTYGLELMTHPELRAFVPVDHEIAAGAGYGEMPLSSMLLALGKLANGRVVRSDGDKSKAEDCFVFAKKSLSITTQKGGRTIERPIYCETSFDLD